MQMIHLSKDFFANHLDVKASAREQRHVKRNRKTYEKAKSGSEKTKAEGENEGQMSDGKAGRKSKNVQVGKVQTQSKPKDEEESYGKAQKHRKVNASKVQKEVAKVPNAVKRKRKTPIQEQVTPKKQKFEQKSEDKGQTFITDTFPSRSQCTSKEKEGKQFKLMKGQYYRLKDTYIVPTYRNKKARYLSDKTFLVDGETICAELDEVEDFE